MGESLLIVITLVAMVGVMLVSIIPFVPGPPLMWLVAVVFGILNDFERLPIFVLVIMTVIMIMGSTTNIWLTYLGVRVDGASCWSGIGTIIGGIAGTMLIPLPICGTFIGAILGALAFELIAAGDLRQALLAGRSAMKSFIMGLAFEVFASFLIFLSFLCSLYFTG